MDVERVLILIDRLMPKERSEVHRKYLFYKIYNYYVSKPHRQIVIHYVILFISRLYYIIIIFLFFDSFPTRNL